MKLAAEKRRATHFSSNEEKEQWIEDYVERETAVARKQVEDPEAAVQQEKEDMKHAEIAGLTKREPKKTFHEMMVVIGDSPSHPSAQCKSVQKSHTNLPDTPVDFTGTPK